MHKSPQSLSDVKRFIQAVDTVYDWPYNAFDERGTGEYLRLTLPGVTGIVSGARLCHGHVTIDVDFNEGKKTFTLLDLAAPQYSELREKKEG